MNCDPSALAQAARCFSCLPPNILEGIKSYLLCQWENAGGGPSPPAPDFGIDWTPANINLEELVGLWAFQNAINMVGVTGITIDHVTNSEGYAFQNCPDLVSISFPNLTHMSDQGDIVIGSDPKLSTLSFPSMTSVGNNQVLRIFTCPLLASINIPFLVPANGNQWVFSGCALTQVFVDAVLHTWVLAGPGIVSGTLTLNGGTSATPSAAGLADKATLIGQGVAVATN